MKNAFTFGGALLAFAVFAAAADARMMGGMNMPSSMTRGDIHTTVPQSLGSSRTFSPDGHSFSSDGLQERVKGSNWKKPIDSDGGGPSDPPKKNSGNGSTQTTSNGNDPPKGAPWGDHHDGYGGYYGGWHHHFGHGGYYCPGRPGC